MPRTKQTPEQRAAAKAEKEAAGIERERPKTVFTKYRNEGGNVIAAVNVTETGKLSFVTVGDEYATLNERQMRDFRTMLTKAINALKSE